jgi:hypothetical protein
MAGPGRFVTTPIVPVRAPRRVEPAVLVLVVAALVIVAAVWKPWGGVAPSTAVAVSSQPSATGEPEAAVPGPIVVIDRAPSDRTPPFAGLDLSYLGVSAENRAWGVAAAFVSRSDISTAIASGVTAVAPISDWVSQTLPPRKTATLLNRPTSVAIAVAVTWPAEVEPRTVALEGARGDPIGLAYPVPALAHLAVSGARNGPALEPGPWLLRSGTFFLPPTGPAAGLSAWPGAGWDPGSYVFVVTAANGDLIRLPFEIVP